MSPRPLSAGERELIDWIARTETRAILPLRVAMLALTALIWEWESRWQLPPSEIFVLFFGYSMAILFAVYCQLFGRLERHQVRPFAISTLLIDGVFIAGLFHLDARLADPGDLSSDYYLLFFLVILRGYAVLVRPSERLLMNGLVLAVFIALSLTHLPSTDPSTIRLHGWRTLAIQTAQIVLVMALSWFLLGTLSRQRTELLSVRERLMRSENLATLGEIVAGVAHEINNPVGIISAYADFLIKKAGDRTELVEDFEVIRSEASRCKQIVGQLLSFANPDTAAHSVVDLADLNDEVLHILFLDKQNNLIDIETHSDPATPPVRIDPVQIKQALLNIYVNARHAMGPQGRIAIDCRPDPDQRRQVRMSIRDSGPGISEESMERLFDPFYTLKDGGTGLGLAITRRVIEAHDGTIEAANAPEGGAVFTIRLPAARRR